MMRPLDERMTREKDPNSLGFVKKRKVIAVQSVRFLDEIWEIPPLLFVISFI